MTADISYRSNIKISSEDFVDLLKRSTLGERRPVDQPDRIQKMLDHGNILVTAWNGSQLVGVSRALTDFSFCCYLSDLAVDTNFQKQGIGKELVRMTHEISGCQTQLVLLAAPAATTYYPKIGLKKFAQCFVLEKKVKHK